MTPATAPHWRRCSQRLVDLRVGFLLVRTVGVGLGLDCLRLRFVAQMDEDGEMVGAKRGAEAMDLSTSVTTRAVQELENLLGVRLLVPTTRRLALTPVGQSVLARADALLTDYADLASMSSLSACEPTGSASALRFEIVERDVFCAVRGAWGEAAVKARGIAETDRGSESSLPPPQPVVMATMAVRGRNVRFIGSPLFL